MKKKFIFSQCLIRPKSSIRAQYKEFDNMSLLAKNDRNSQTVREPQKS